jgi:hypothetical protein
MRGGARLRADRVPRNAPLRRALDSCVGCVWTHRPMRLRLLFPRSFGRGRGSVSQFKVTLTLLLSVLSFSDHLHD